MVTDYSRKIMLRASDRNYIFPIFFRSLPTFPCFLSYFLGLPVLTLSLLFAGKPVEALETIQVKLGHIRKKMKRLSKTVNPVKFFFNGKVANRPMSHSAGAFGQ